MKCAFCLVFLNNGGFIFQIHAGLAGSLASRPGSWNSKDMLKSPTELSKHDFRL
jgi:hypothetical protein